MISTPTPPHRTEYSGSLSDFRASTRSNSLGRHNTPDKNTRDRGEIGLNYGPCGIDGSKKAERAIESKDLPSYLGGAVFQNGSACFRLHVGHSAGEAAEGEGCCCGGCRCCCNPRMLLISHRKTTHGNDSSRTNSLITVSVQQRQKRVPSSCGTGSRRWRPILEYINAACKDQCDIIVYAMQKLHKSNLWVAMSRLNKYIWLNGIPFSCFQKKRKLHCEGKGLKFVLITHSLSLSS